MPDNGLIQEVNQLIISSKRLPPQEALEWLRLAPLMNDQQLRQLIQLLRSMDGKLGQAVKSSVKPFSALSSSEKQAQQQSNLVLQKAAPQTLNEETTPLSLRDHSTLRDEPSVQRPEAAHGSKAGSGSKRVPEELQSRGDLAGLSASTKVAADLPLARPRRFPSIAPRNDLKKASVNPKLQKWQDDTRRQIDELELPAPKIDSPGKSASLTQISMPDSPLSGVDAVLPAFMQGAGLGNMIHPLSPAGDLSQDSIKNDIGKTVSTAKPDAAQREPAKKIADIDENIKIQLDPALAASLGMSPQTQPVSPLPSGLSSINANSQTSFQPPTASSVVDIPKPEPSPTAPPSSSAPPPPAPLQSSALPQIQPAHASVNVPARTVPPPSVRSGVALHQITKLEDVSTLSPESLRAWGEEGIFSALKPIVAENGWPVVRLEFESSTLFKAYIDAGRKTLGDSEVADASILARQEFEAVADLLRRLSTVM